ncbi:MAG TPA: hypothetical protein VH593_25315 [Ktedonobacteraceae bacterium]
MSTQEWVNRLDRAIDLAQGYRSVCGQSKLVAGSRVDELADEAWHWIGHICEVRNPSVITIAMAKRLIEREVI